jgi:hypothetical protein
LAGRGGKKPEEYLRRSLERALFADGGLTQAVSGEAPILDVELLAFEEVRRGSKRSAEVKRRYVLRDERVVIAAGEVRIEEPSRDDEPEHVVAAIGVALLRATRQLTARVRAKLPRVQPLPARLTSTPPEAH